MEDGVDGSLGLRYVEPVRVGGVGRWTSPVEQQRDEPVLDLLGGGKGCQGVRRCQSGAQFLEARILGKAVTQRCLHCPHCGVVGRSEERRVGKEGRGRRAWEEAKWRKSKHRDWSEQ